MLTDDELEMEELCDLVAGAERASRRAVTTQNESAKIQVQPDRDVDEMIKGVLEDQPKKPKTHCFRIIREKPWVVEAKIEPKPNNLRAQGPNDEAEFRNRTLRTEDLLNTEFETEEFAKKCLEAHQKRNAPKDKS